MAAEALITEEQFLEILEKEKGETSIREFAEKNLRGAVSQQFLCNVTKGRKHPGAALAKALGYEQVVAFRKIAPKRRK